MTEISTAYPEIEASIINTYANKASREAREAIYNSLAKYFPESYDNPLGQIPEVVEGAVQIISGEVWLAAQELGRRKLQRKLREGMEALLNAD